MCLKLLLLFKGCITEEKHASNKGNRDKFIWNISGFRDGVGVVKKLLRTRGSKHIIDLIEICSKDIYRILYGLVVKSDARNYH